MQKFQPQVFSNNLHSRSSQNLERTYNHSTWQLIDGFEGCVLEAVTGNSRIIYLRVGWGNSVMILGNFTKVKIHAKVLGD